MENINIDWDYYKNNPGIIDRPDTRDYTHEEVFGEIQSLVAGIGDEDIVLNKVENLAQGRLGMCSVMGSTNAYNETLAQRLPRDIPYTQPYNPFEVWKKALTLGASNVYGWYFQSALQLLKDLGHIGGYVLINSTGLAHEGRMRNILAGKRAIATGVVGVDWGQTVRYNELVEGKGAGHIFDIKGYFPHYKCRDGSMGAFYSPNSFGKGGEFYIPVSKLHLLFSQYELLLEEDTKKLIEAKKIRANAYLQKAYEKKIWNEERPNDTATAREISIMINRALGVGESYKWFRKHFAILMQDKVLRGKVESEKIQLYNKEGGYIFATDYEIGIMFTRAVMRNPGINELVLSRRQVAEIMGRDFL